MSELDDRKVDTPDEFYSTHLNPRIKTFDNLAIRIARDLGYPQVNTELHVEQVYDAIARACEMFTKFAGFTEEHLVFKSDLYKPGEGIRMDTLMSITPEMEATYEIDSAEKSAYSVGNMVIGDPDKPFHVVEEGKSPVVKKAYDHLLNSYRRVVSVSAFEVGTSSGVNTLFTLEQTMAQQTYFSYALGKYGFDLVSWYTLKEWLDVREKLLSQKFYFRFDERRQTLYLLPEPGIKSRFYGLVSCYVERPLSDIVKELWVQQYATALCKIMLGTIRSKYAGTALFGGGSINAEIGQQGQAEKDALEEKLYNNDAGLGDQVGSVFLVG